MADSELFDGAANNFGLLLHLGRDRNPLLFNLFSTCHFTTRINLRVGNLNIVMEKWVAILTGKLNRIPVL